VRVLVEVVELLRVLVAGWVVAGCAVVVRLDCVAVVLRVLVALVLLLVELLRVLVLELFVLVVVRAAPDCSTACCN